MKRKAYGESSANASFITYTTNLHPFLDLKSLSRYEDAVDSAA